MTDERVPRNQAFWNTYHDVQRELAETALKIRCREERHIQESRGSQSFHCSCGLSPVEAARDLGYKVEVGENGSFKIYF